MSASKAEVNEKQIFVRNLPFDVTSENLSELFEDIGPLKNTSVASENGVGKGFGFVKFALESDAKLAIEKLQGHVFHGRKIILELGHKKERKGRSKETADQDATDTGDVEATPVKVKVDNAANKKEKKERAKAMQDKSDECSVGGDSIKKSRQVLVFGIPMDINKKHFRALATKGFRKTEVDLLKEDHELSGELHITTPAGKVMLLTAPSRQEAGKITTALNNATVHSLIVALQAHHKLQVAQQQLLNKKKVAKGKAEGKETVNKVETAKDPLEGLDLSKPRKEKLFLRTAAQITPTDQRKRKCRLIIRNLSFLATEQNVLDKMSKFGPIVSVELPKKAPTERTEDSKFQGMHRRPEKENKEPAARSMGFGFVTFLCESDAQHVVENCAGLKVCNREVAIDFCMAKETYEKFGKKQDEQSAAEATTEGADKEEEADSNESVHGSDEEGSADGDEHDGAEDSAGEDGSDNGDEDSQEDEEGDSEMDTDGDSEGDDSDRDEGASDSDGDSAPSKAKAAPEKVKKEPTEDVHEGCTVFVRGLGFDAEPADLKRSLGKYGRISLALIVKDKVTDISKGTAFVKFLSAESASACVAEALLLGGISIKDRSCKIDLAVDRQSAQNIKDTEAAKRGKDKRNLYLQNEGLILPGVEGSDEHAAAHKAANMSEADKEKRMRAQTEKRKKLVNPLFFVSANRLSIRNLAKTVTDKELREICLNAAKNGIKKGLVKRSDMEQYRSAQGIDYVQQQAALHGFAKAGADLDAVPPAVGKHCLKNAKIMLDMQRIRGGAPQSRGYAFAEFTHHAHALACLRELNNNAAYSSHHSNAPSAAQADPTGGKLIVEFALENIQKVKILRDREARVQKRKSDSAPDTDAAASKPDARTLKRQKAAAEAKDSSATRSTSAPAAVEVPVTAVAVPKKPVKSYIVDPNTLPVALPEGVNPKLHNRQLEKERLKRKRQEKAAAPAVPAAAASTDAPAAKKVKTETAPSVVPPKAQPAAPKQAEAAKPAKVVSKPAVAPVVDASNGAVSGKKRKESPDSVPVPVPAVVQKTPKHQQAEAAEPQAKKQKAAAPAPVQPKSTSVVADASTTPAKGEPKQKKVNFEAKKDNFTPTKPVSHGNKHVSTPGAKQANNKNDNKNGKQDKQSTSPKGGSSPEGTPVQRPWGGHKRLRAKKAGGKK